MKEGINQIVFAGNIGRDAELRSVNDASVCSFRVASTASWWDKQSESRKEHTEWMTIDLWGKRGESLCQHLTRGTEIIVTGSIRTRESEKNGEKRWFTSIRADNVVFCGSKRQQQDQQASAPQQQGPPAHTQDDIPF